MKKITQKNRNPNPDEKILKVKPIIIPDEESNLLRPSFMYLNCSLVFTSNVLEIHFCKSLKRTVNCLSRCGKSLLKLESCVAKK